MIPAPSSLRTCCLLVHQSLFSNQLFFRGEEHGLLDAVWQEDQQGKAPCGCEDTSEEEEALPLCKGVRVNQCFFCECLPRVKDLQLAGDHPTSARRTRAGHPH